MYHATSGIPDAVRHHNACGVIRGSRFRTHQTYVGFEEPFSSAACPGRMVRRVPYLKYALAPVLIFIGSKIFLADLLAWRSSRRRLPSLSA